MYSQIWRLSGSLFFLTRQLRQRHCVVLRAAGCEKPVLRRGQGLLRLRDVLARTRHRFDHQPGVRQQLPRHFHLLRKYAVSTSKISSSTRLTCLTAQIVVDKPPNCVPFTTTGSPTTKSTTTRTTTTKSTTTTTPPPYLGTLTCASRSRLLSLYSFSHRRRCHLTCKVSCRRWKSW